MESFVLPSSPGVIFNKTSMLDEMNSVVKKPRGYRQVWLAGKIQSVMSPVYAYPKAYLKALLVYEIQHLSSGIHKSKINMFIRKRFKVPPGLTDVAMYGHKARLRLYLKSIV
ncbi:hypothetical protein PoB_000481500 [Plakobranchus ocellatus]|uniref:Uncharacterized protein n=1 Tax=Plakobranchus ocellatus TaxID=259542 RepID=A0AAV3Y753_9GAST|nr:hypothetical protein PoB_000481500 [Plakobranchus ocellatus]